MKDASAAYRRANKKNLEDEIERMADGDLKALMLAKLGKTKGRPQQGESKHQ